MRGGRKPWVVESACKIADAATDVVLKYAPPTALSIALINPNPVCSGLI